MKKFTILMAALALWGTLLVGCGCMNSEAEMTTKPTTAPTTSPSTAATTMPTTMPTTSATQPTAMDGSTSETAGENGMVETESTGSGDMNGNSKSKSGSNNSTGITGSVGQMPNMG